MNTLNGARRHGSFKHVGMIVACCLVVLLVPLALAAADQSMATEVTAGVNVQVEVSALNIATPSQNSAAVDLPKTVATQSKAEIAGSATTAPDPAPELAIPGGNNLLDENENMELAPTVVPDAPTSDEVTLPGAAEFDIAAMTRVPLSPGALTTTARVLPLLVAHAPLVDIPFTVISPTAWC